MILRHASPNRNRLSISDTGLRKEFATGKRKAVWLHPAGKSWWAMEHVSNRHQCTVKEVDLWWVFISPTDPLLKRGPHGTYYYLGDIPTSDLTKVKSSLEYLSFADDDGGTNGGAA